MRRHLLALALVGLFGSLFASNASACCHKRRACAPAPCAPVVCAAPAPCAPVVCAAPAPCPAPRKKCCFGGFKFKGFCHKRQACAPVACVAPAPCPVVVPSAQATPQS